MVHHNLEKRYSLRRIVLWKEDGREEERNCERLKPARSEGGSEKRRGGRDRVDGLEGCRQSKSERQSR